MGKNLRYRWGIIRKCNFYSRVERTVREWRALSRTDEHQLGIVADINADQLKCSNDEVSVRLVKNAC